MTRRASIPGHVAELHRHLAQLDTEALARRVRAMAATGIADHDIAALLGLHVDYVRQIIAAHHTTTTTERRT